MNLYRVCAILTSLLLLLCLTATQAAAERTVPSTDRLPLGDWTYDAMVTLAANGHVPGYTARVFQGDRLFNRIEMAQVVASVLRVTAGKSLTRPENALIGKLASEFEPELNSVDPEVLEECPPASFMEPKTFVQGYNTVVDGGLRRRHSRTVLELFSNLSDRTFALAGYASKRPRFFEGNYESPDPERVFIRGNGGNFLWSLGREYLNWGPAYSGSLILSDNSAAFLQARGAKEIDFGKFFGRIKITQFASTFRDNGENLYLFGRRYERPISRRWHLGISETAKTSTTPNPLILAMPFYLYQHVFNEVDEEFNSLYAADLLYQMKGGNQAYLEFLIDDITAPRIFGDSFDRPRKTGWTLGYYDPRLFGGRRLSTFRAEYIFVDRLTYEATRPGFPELAYTHNTDIIGHPIGANAKALYLRGEHYLSSRLSLIAEYLNQQQTDTGSPEREQRRVLSLALAYDTSKDDSIGIRIAPFKIAPPGLPSDSGTTFEFRWTSRSLFDM